MSSNYVITPSGVCCSQCGLTCLQSPRIHYPSSVMHIAQNIALRISLCFIEYISRLQSSGTMTSVCVYKLRQGKLVPSLLAFMVASSQKVARQLTSIARETSKFKTSWVGRNLKDGLPPGLHRWMKAEPDLDLQPLCSADLNNLL